MTKIVKEKSTNLTDGVKNLIATANSDYIGRNYHNGAGFNELEDNQKDTMTKMNDKFVNGWTITEGSKYIRLRASDYGTWGFIVKTDNDKMFKKGDLLMPAGYDKPARNAPRGNVLKGNFPINWTGPLYLN